MENLVNYLVYKKNPLRQLGIVGLKSLHLESDPVKHKAILDSISTRFGDHRKLTNAERTLAQFLCQESLYSNVFQKIVAKFLFFGLLPMVFVYLIFKSFTKAPFEKCDVFIFELGDLDYVKSDFQNKTIKSGSAGSIGNYLGLEEYKFLFKLLWKHPVFLWHPKLMVNTLRWLSTYAWVVKYRRPEVLATFFEGTASSSLLTEYLHIQNAKHYNYAHGEHFKFDCHSSYANFDKYTIWGDHFKNIQIEKNCREEMFRVKLPETFKYFHEKLRKIPKKNENQITVLIHSGVESGLLEYDSLVTLLSGLEENWSIVLRPHPVDRASWPKVMSDLKADLRHKDNIDFTAEYPEEVPMTESVQKSKIFIGSASAALLEANLAGCKIIYIPGRIKNSDLVNRHQGSKNVLAFNPCMNVNEVKLFLQSDYTENASEEKIISYLFLL